MASDTFLLTNLTFTIAMKDPYCPDCRAITSGDCGKHYSVNPTPQPAKERLEEILDREFPKGKCKERGGALMLLAEAMILLKENTAATLREVMESLPKAWPHEETFDQKARGFEHGYNDCREEITCLLQHKLTSEL